MPGHLPGIPVSILGMLDMATKSVLLNILCENLRRSRKARGVTQVDMAQRLGIKQSAYSEIERGVCSPTLTTIEKLASALSIAPADLLKPPEQISARTA